MTEIMQAIPARLKNIAVGGHVAGADQIIDDQKNKTQETINSEVDTALGNLGSALNAKADKSAMTVTPGTGANADKTTIQLKSGTSATVLTQHQDISGKANTSDVNTALADKQDTINDLTDIRNGAAAGATAQQPATTLAGYGITDAYSKTEINDHIDTPNQGYITAAAESNTTTANLKTLIDTAAGSDKEKADFIYRVGSWDGSQYDETVYSEYAWNGTDYIFLSKKSQVDEVFDISAYHANTPYADLTAALGTNGANVPQALRKGGMSIKFIQGSVGSSDNKYVQYRLMAQNFTTDVTQWQGIDDEPTAGSENLVKSDGVEKMLAHNVVYVDDPVTEVGAMSDSGVVDSTATSFSIVRPILLNAGETIVLNNGNSTFIKNGGALLYETDSSGNWIRNIITRSTVGGGTTIAIAKYTNTSSASMYVGTTIYTEGTNQLPVYNIVKMVNPAPENITDKIANIIVLPSDVRKGSILANDSINIVNNRVYTEKHIKVIPGANYLIDLPSDYTYLICYYTKQKVRNGNSGSFSSKKGFKIPTDIEYIRIVFEKTGLTIDNFILMPIVWTMPNDLFFQVKQELSDALPNIDTANKKLVFGASARLRYNGTWISIANLELNYINSYSDITLLIFSTSTLGLRTTIMTDVLPDDIIVGYINHSGSTAKTIFDVSLPFEYTIDGQSVNSKISKLEEKCGALSDNHKDVYSIAKDIKDNRPYFLNESYANEVSYNDSSYLDAKIRNIPNGKHFIFSTDSHLDYGPGTEGYGLSQRETEIMAYVKAKLNIGCVIFGGDAVGGMPSSFDAAKELAVFTEDKFNAFGSYFLWVEGNHDANNADGQVKIPSVEIFKRTTKVMQRYGKAVFDTEGLAILDSLELSDNDKKEAKAWFSQHYYYDDEASKIRFIVIESGDGSYGASVISNINAFNGWQLLTGYITFIGEALQSTPHDYDVVIAMHQMLRESCFENGEITSILVRPVGDLYNMLAAFKNHTSVTVYGDQDGEDSRNTVLYALQTNRMDNIAGTYQKTFDFSNRSAGRVFVITGHFHIDDAWIMQREDPTSSVWNFRAKEYGQWDTVTSDATLVIMTDRTTMLGKGTWAGSSYAPNSVSYPDNGNEVGQEVRVGTKNEVLFDVVTLTPDGRVVCTRIGAGSDREFYLP